MARRGDVALQPRSNRAVMQYVRQLLRYFPAARSQAQIAGDAAAFASRTLQPQADEIARAAQARLGSGQQAIGSLTRQYQDRLAPIAGDQRTADEAAKTDSARQTAALAAFLASHGEQAANQIAAHAIGATADAAPVLNAATKGVGDSAAGAAAASGTASYDRLNADAATRQGRLRELPALASLAGVNASRELAGQTEFATADALGKLRATAPSLVSSYSAEAQRANQARGAAAVSLAQGALGQEIQKGIARQSLGLGLQKIAASVGNNKRTTATSAENNTRTTATSRANTKDRVAVAAKAKTDAATKTTNTQIFKASKNTQDFAVKLRSGTLGQSSQGGLYGGGSSGAVTDYSTAFHRVAQYLRGQLGDKIALGLGEPWMRRKVNAILGAAGYSLPTLGGNPHTDPATRGD